MKTKVCDECELEKPVGKFKKGERVCAECKRKELKRKTRNRLKHLKKRWRTEQE